MAVVGQGRTQSVTVIPETASPLLDAFTFDLTSSMKISYPGKAFPHPVQNGVEGITDAVHLESPVFSVTGITANTPIVPLAGFLPFSRPLTDATRMTTQLGLLLAIRELKVPVTVLCSWLPPLRSRWPEVVDAERNTESGTTIGVSVNFVRMRIVTTSLVPALQDSDIVALGSQTVEFGPLPIEVQPFT